MGRGLGKGARSQGRSLRESGPSPAAALGCGDGTGAVFPHVRVPAGSQVLASPANAAARAMLEPLQKPHFSPWDLCHLKRGDGDLGPVTSSAQLRLTLHSIKPVASAGHGGSHL